MNSLKQKRILITRPARQAGELRTALESRGARVDLAALIRTEPIQTEAVRRALQRLEEFDWLAFTSVNGVEYFQASLSRFGMVLPPAPQIAVIGKSTAAAVERCGWQVALLPQRASSEGMTEAFRDLELRGKKIALFVAETTREILPGALVGMGAEVTPVALYRTLPDAAGIDLLAGLPWPEIDAVVFLSGSAAEVFAAYRPAAAATGRLAYLAVGSATAERMRQLNLPVDRVAEQPSTEAIVRALERAFPGPDISAR